MNRVRNHSLLSDQIHRYIDDHGAAGVPTIAHFFAITESAARNQVDKLRKQKRIKNVCPVRCVKSGRKLPAVYSSTTPPPGKAKKPPMQAPETQFKTQWIGGAHPCEVVNPWARLAA